MVQVSHKICIYLSRGKGRGGRGGRGEEEGEEEGKEEGEEEGEEGEEAEEEPKTKILATKWKKTLFLC